MSGGKNPERPSRRLRDDELLVSFEAGLTTLQHLAKAYDSGHAPIAFLMATEVQKILTENGAATRLRGTRIFTTPGDIKDEERIVSSMHKLTGLQLGGDPPTLTFVPQFYLGEDELKPVPFREWWNRDVIYRASAAEPGTPAGLIPVNGTPEVPFAEREHVNRRQLVNLLRNKLGAHQEREMPELLDELQSANTWGVFVCETEVGQLSTLDGSLITVVGPLPAMMRQITHELLKAYGRDDPAPAQFQAASPGQEASIA